MVLTIHDKGRLKLSLLKPLSRFKNTLDVAGQKYHYFDINRLEKSGYNVSSLPFSIKILLESAIRNYDGMQVTDEHIANIANWQKSQWESVEVPFKPARIILQDYTGVPALVDLASMRNGMKRKGGDVSRINPHIPVELVIDHSMIVEHFGSSNSLNANVRLEYERNKERYRFIKWAQNSFSNFKVVPPANGIVHQVNLEYLSSPIVIKSKDNELTLFPDSLVGTDSHTPMINGLGIIGWGVGGIEAEAAMLGQPIYFVLPQVVGVKLVGKLQAGVTATDLALTITSLLRKKGVVGKFVEFFGEGVQNISITDRATIANMAPEYGATMAYFPVDHLTLSYFEQTGREENVNVAKTYYEAQGLYKNTFTTEPIFTETIEINLDTIQPTIAGPKRPQDSFEISRIKEEFKQAVISPIEKNGYGLDKSEFQKEVKLHDGTVMKTGAVVLAAITSCTNTSNPNVMVAAGLLAKKAFELGLRIPSYVKTSLTPGSKAVTGYLEKSGLLTALEELGFYIDGYGCAVCCGNSGSLIDSVEQVIKENNLLVASVLSGNRNFEGRVHPLTKANYLCSPPLVIAYALAGTVNIDLDNEPIGFSRNDKPVFLKDIWPTDEEIQEVITTTIDKKYFKNQYKNIFDNEFWSNIESPVGEIYNWNQQSTYIQESPFFQDKNNETEFARFKNMQALLYLGDSITTDHISPVGTIPKTSSAGIYLNKKGVPVRDFNSYGSRRGNHHVMVRGTFANIRIRNKLADGKEGGYTKFIPTGEILPVYDAAMKYKEINQNLIIIAGKEYGTGSSRDWAAKGTALLGVKAVLAESFERIHRSNLVGMGVLPLQFLDGENAESLKLDGTETFDITFPSKEIVPNQKVEIKATKHNGNDVIRFQAILRLDSLVEIEYFQDGGILQSVFKKMS